MHPQIIAFMAFLEPKLFLVCGLLLLVCLIPFYISSHRDIFHHLPEFQSVLLDLEKKVVLYILTDEERKFSQKNLRKIKKMYRTIHSTGSSRSATEEELKIGFSNDPGLEAKFSAIVISRNNKPFIISTNKDLKTEKIGFAVIKKPVII